MTLYEISELIVNGFEKLVIYPGKSTNKYDACKGCDELLLAWDGVAHYMDEMNISDIWELEKKQILEFKINNIYPSLIFQVLVDELHNAGKKDNIYFKKRIEYCTDFLKFVGDDETAIGNARMAIADSYFELGDEAECDRLYGEWLEADPKWSRGYVGWASNYEYVRHGSQNMEKAGCIYEKALGVDSLRGREYLLENALSFYENLENSDKTVKLRNELSQLQAKSPKHLSDQAQIPESFKKSGRNDPCPCGSGKKYKKCCGA